MDGLTLLAEARAAGLEVRAEGDRLVIRGPRKAEALAKRRYHWKTSHRKKTLATWRRG